MAGIIARCSCARSGQSLIHMARDLYTCMYHIVRVLELICGVVKGQGMLIVKGHEECGGGCRGISVNLPRLLIDPEWLDEQTNSNSTAQPTRVCFKFYTVQYVSQQWEG